MSDTVSPRNIPCLDRGFAPEYFNTIREAFRRGYRFDFDNQVLKREKTEWIPKLYGKQRYPSVSINIGGKIKSFPLHKFCAYQLYGEKTFTKGLVVRHLDGNTLNLNRNNLKLGTHSQNNLDKPKIVRQSAARKARASQPYRPYNTKLTKAQVEEIRLSVEYGPTGRAKRGFCKGLAQKFCVSKSAISQALKGITHG